MDIIDQAILFATEAHEGQYRKGSQTPYILHPLEVGAILAAMTDDAEVIAAGILHDVLEDTPLDASKLAEKFGLRVLKLVQAESEDKQVEIPAGESWKARKQQTIDDLVHEMDPAVKMICLADKLSNIRAIRNDYAKIGEKLWTRFNQKDPAQHAWYYRSIYENTGDLSEFTTWQEYKILVEQVFDKYPVQNKNDR